MLVLDTRIGLNWTELNSLMHATYLWSTSFCTRNGVVQLYLRVVRARAVIWTDPGVYCDDGSGPCEFDECAWSRYWRGTSTHRRAESVEDSRCCVSAPSPKRQSPIRREFDPDHHCGPMPYDVRTEVHSLRNKGQSVMTKDIFPLAKTFLPPEFAVKGTRTEEEELRFKVQWWRILKLRVNDFITEVHSSHKKRESNDIRSFRFIFESIYLREHCQIKKNNQNTRKNKNKKNLRPPFFRMLKAMGYDFIKRSP